MTLAVGFPFSKCSFENMVKELESFIFFDIKAQIFGDKKDIVSVPYLTVFAFLAYNSLRILKSYSIILLTLKTSPIIAGDKPCTYLGIYNFQLLNSGHFFDQL